MKYLISTKNKPIGLASDHAGYEMKQHLISLLDKAEIKYVDFGTNGSESVDYPDFAHKLGKAIDSGECEHGIAICGTGNGINIALNKHQSVRAALCWNTYIAKMARAHNNANVLTLPGRIVSEKEAEAMLVTYLETEFEGGRHQKRIDKIPCLG